MADMVAIGILCHRRAGKGERPCSKSTYVFELASITSPDWSSPTLIYCRSDQAYHDSLCVYGRKWYWAEAYLGDDPSRGSPRNLKVWDMQNNFAGLEELDKIGLGFILKAYEKPPSGAQCGGFTTTNVLSYFRSAQPYLVPRLDDSDVLIIIWNWSSIQQVAFL